MARKFTETKLVIASHNPGKVVEINELLEPFGVEAISAGELNLPEPIEDGLTFIANAELKARASTLGSGLPALADDSGIVVPALNGDPGIYSARWAGENKDFDFAMEKIRGSLETVGETPEGQAAYFACALSLCWPTSNGVEHIETVEGIVHGTLTFPPRGTMGFGYDPIFVPTGHQFTFGEMEPTKKHAMSHRADAFKKLVTLCFK